MWHFNCGSTKKQRPCTNKADKVTPASLSNLRLQVKTDQDRAACQQKDKDWDQERKQNKKEIT